MRATEIENAEQLVAALKGGKLSGEFWKEHLKAIDAAGETGKAATVMIKVTYGVKESSNGDIVAMKGSVDSKIPQVEVTDAYFSHNKKLTSVPEGQVAMNLTAPEEVSRDNVTSIKDNRDA